MAKISAMERLQAHGSHIAIVLGSGLNAIVGDTEDSEVVAYRDFPGIPKPSVPGHTGRFVLGRMGPEKIIFAQGRVHLYEGFSARDITAGVRVLAEAGVERLILTNAAGAANPNFKPGDWMMITDQINLTGTSPLAGRDRSPRRSPSMAKAGRTAQRAVSVNVPEFVDLTAAFSRKWQHQFRRAARNIDIVLHEGVYAGLLGPQYETPAEVRMLRKLGADAIGMSTVLETIQARALGLEVAGFSCITNLAACVARRNVSHEEVLETGSRAAGDFARLLKSALAMKPE